MDIATWSHRRRKAATFEPVTCFCNLRDSPHSLRRADVAARQACDSIDTVVNMTSFDPYSSGWLPLREQLHRTSPRRQHCSGALADKESAKWIVGLPPDMVAAMLTGALPSFQSRNIHVALGAGLVVVCEVMRRLIWKSARREEVVVLLQGELETETDTRILCSTDRKATGY